MRGIKSDDLLAIVDFLYSGDANVYQENLDSFLAIAEELQLRGLMGKTDSDQGENSANDPKHPPKELKSDQSLADIAKEPSVIKKRLSSQNTKADQALALPYGFGLEDLEERVVSMMEKSQHHIGKQPAYICKVCGKEARCRDMKHHIEANHLEGVAIPCNLCDKTFRSRQTLNEHIRNTKTHQNIAISGPEIL